MTTPRQTFFPHRIIGFQLCTFRFRTDAMSRACSSFLESQETHETCGKQSFEKENARRIIAPGAQITTEDWL